MPLQGILGPLTRLPRKYRLRSSWEYNLIRLKRDVNARKQSARKNTVNVTTQANYVENSANAKVARIAEFPQQFFYIHLLSNCILK